MKDFDSLVDIWQAQKTAPEINYQTIIENNKKSKNNLKLKLLVGCIIMLIGIVIIFYLWIHTPFSYISSHISLLLFLGCGAYYIYRQILNISLLNNDSLLKTPSEHIEFLKKFKALRFKENTKNFLIYTVLMSVGFFLYFIEFFSQVNMLVSIMTITITLVWILACYFYFQKIYLKKEEQTLKDMIDNLDRIKNQFKN